MALKYGSVTLIGRPLYMIYGYIQYKEFKGENKNYLKNKIISIKIKLAI